jgi:hypothetical protein
VSGTGIGLIREKGVQRLIGDQVPVGREAFPTRLCLDDHDIIRCPIGLDEGPFSGCRREQVQEIL